MKIEGFKDGEKAWMAAVYIHDGYGRGPASAGVYVREATVILAEAGIIREGAEPRIVGVGETLHRTQQQAREWAAAELRRSAANLYRQAEEVAEPRVVTV
jgi:hypothetical protein